MFHILSFNLWQICVGFSTALFIIYWFLTKNFNYWTKIGVKGPKPMVLFGNFLDRVLNPMGPIGLEYMKKFGNIYGIFFGSDPVLQITEPELIKQILVKDFHLFSDRRALRTEHEIINKNLFHSRREDWRRMRNILSSTFTSGKMKRMYPLIRDCLTEYLEYLEVKAQEANEVDAKVLFSCLTMDVIASCAFGTKTNAINDSKNPFVMNVNIVVDFKPLKMIPAFVFPKWLNKMLNITSFFDEKACQWMFDVSRHMIETRRNGHKKGHKFNDFIQILIDAKANENNIIDSNDHLLSHYINEGEEEMAVEKDVLKTVVSDKTLSENEIIAQSWLFLIAGFETTSTTLGFISYALALNPECQQRLYEEVMSALDSDGEIGYDELNRLPYLDAIISETLRLFPPVNSLERECNEDYRLGDTGITLYKGQAIEIPVYALHNCEDNYKNANQFIPERFLSENRHQLIPYTYLPFGSGPRNCIGNRFALMEIKLALVHIIKRFRFEKCSKTDIPLEYKSVVMTLSAKRILLKINKR